MKIEKVENEEEKLWELREHAQKSSKHPFIYKLFCNINISKISLRSEYDTFINLFFGLYYSW